MVLELLHRAADIVEDTSSEMRGLLNRAGEKVLNCKVICVTAVAVRRGMETL